MRIGIVIQARMGSTRLSGKVLKNLMGKSILAHVIERVKQVNNIDEIIIATTILKRDDAIVNEAIKYNAKVYRGSEEDVLSRYYEAAEKYSLDTIVRVTSDCPLIDPHIIDSAIELFKDKNSDIVSNAGLVLSNRTYPRGLDAEVFSFRALENSYLNASEHYQREHVTPYIYEHTENVTYLINSIDYSGYRWTLDTEDDYKLITAIYDHFYKNQHDFYLKDIIGFMKSHPELTQINAHIEQKKIK